MFKKGSLQNSNYLSILGYVFFSCILLLIIDKWFYTGLLRNNNFTHWDAEHYSFVKNHGYTNTVSVAFFPLFPYTWKLLSCSPIGISIFNGFIFLTAFYFLAKSLKLNQLEALFYLSIPSGIFYFLPYTEALFFATSSMVLIGYKKNNSALIFLGLLLSATVRPIFAFFVIAMIITELYNSKITGKTLLRIGLFILALVVGLLTVFGLHKYYTGNWFAYFEIVNAWGGGILQLPVLPFTSWSGGMIVRLDAFAMLIGISAGLVLIAAFFKLNRFKTIIVPKEVIFSLAYLGAITLFITFRGGSIFSLNRFVFAVPFLIVAFHFWLTLPIRIKPRHLLHVFGITTLFWLLFGSYSHVQTILKFALISLYVLLIFLIKFENKYVSQFSLIGFILVNVVFQLLFLLRFLNGNWVA